MLQNESGGVQYVPARAIEPSTIRRHCRTHPAATASLSAWLLISSRTSWASISDVRKVYPHADAVLVGSGRVVTIFNISGNKFRLVVAIHYNTQRVYVREFMNHAQYNH